MATPITTPFFHLDGSDDRDLRAYKAWFKAEGRQQLSRNPRRQHLLHVSQLLLEGARDKAYDRLIIIAAEPMLAELKDALAPEARALVIGKIICDYASLEPPAPCEPPEMRH
jgi:protein required for attachment to host cells